MPALNLLHIDHDLKLRRTNFALNTMLKKPANMNRISALQPIPKTF